MKRIIYLIPLALLLSFNGLLQAQKLTQAEYFYDTDPGVGKGTSVTIASPSDTQNLTLNLPSGSLQSGWHFLYFRFKDSLNVWGEFTTQSFYVSPGNIDTAAHSSPQISGAEYFFDADPGVGKGTALAVSTPSDSVNISPNIPIGSLSGGFHFLYTRFKYSDGVWGNFFTQSFYVSPGTIDTAAFSSPQINRVEYFVDSDPGNGNGTAIVVSTPSDSVNISPDITTGKLNPGFHYLYVRFGYTNQVWGMPVRNTFYVLPPADTTAPINYAEYFFDADPGVGNGHQVAVNPGTDSANIAVDINTTGLGSGVHVLFFRFRYTNGVWGLYQPQGDTVILCHPPVVNIAASGGTTFCSGSSSVTLSSDTSSVYHYQWQLNGNNLPGDTLSTLVVTDSGGIYNVVVTDSGCPGISDSITVTVYPVTNNSSNLTLCNGDSTTFNGQVLTQSGTYSDTAKSVNGCDSITTLVLTVYTNTVNWPGGNDTVCSNTAPITLSGALPAEGTYSGTGDSNGVFTPGIADTGTTTILYIYTQGICNDTARRNFVVEVCTGIEQVNEYSFNLYPNPASELVIIESDAFNNAKPEIKLYDLTGRLIGLDYDLNANQIQLHTAELAQGMYMVAININGQTINRRFVKE